MYDDYQCNESFYTPIHGNISDICKKYHFSISVYKHGGAFGMFTCYVITIGNALW